MPTAFAATYGEGHPHLGILAEYDGLSGMSQEANIADKQSIENKDKNHSCGHNLFAGGSLAAALAVKSFIEKRKEGSIVLFGCPGEEGGAGKAFMAKEGLWYDLDCALTWHPGDANEVAVGTCNSCIQILYKYKGVASHAAGDPEHGRSALDAVELMNVGVQYLR